MELVVYTGVVVSLISVVVKVDVGLFIAGWASTHALLDGLVSLH